MTTIIGSYDSGYNGIYELLLKMNRQHSGTIKIDDIDIKNIQNSVYYNTVALVTPTPFFFNLSIKDNLLIVNKDFKEIEKICEELGIYKEIKALPDGFNTIVNEIKRGTVLLYNGTVSRYKADVGYRVYLEHRQKSRRNYRCLETVDFLKYVEQQFMNEKWSFDACVGYAKEHHLFDEKEMVCTKTLYNYADLGVISIRNIDLPEKISRNTKVRKKRQNKKKLGKSIEERPEEIDEHRAQREAEEAMEAMLQKKSVEEYLMEL